MDRIQKMRWRRSRNTTWRVVAAVVILAVMVTPPPVKTETEGTESGDMPGMVSVPWGDQSSLI